MIHCIAGTAGHIDHGKTALVRALTGIDTDRLEEEKRRGISIDLGFAHVSPGEGVECGIVDVPGHERFVKNMLAGVGGIDMVLLIIAADESIKPQTREHFDICRLLGIERGIVVITKSDLVDGDLIELVKMEAEEFVAGSFLQGAAVIAVSSVTGAGMDDLKREIVRLAKSLPHKDANRHFRLPVDRAFSMKGFGAVVTGTLVAGSVQVEQEAELHPGSRKVRVRGVQVHGQAVKRAVTGQRTALNLAGVDAADLHRGMVLSAAGLFQATTTVDCAVDLLASAKPLKNRAPVHFHSGAAEIEAEVRLPESKMTPGSSGYVRIVLREAALLLPGDRFILRMFSPVITIAGGRVLDASPPRRLREDLLAILHRGTLPEQLSLYVSESPYGLGMADLVARTGLLEKEIAAALAKSSLRVIAEQQWAIESTAFTALAERLKKALASFHKQNPLLPGMSKEEARGRELKGAPVFLLDALLKATPGVVAEGDVLRLASHKLAFREDEKAALQKIEDAFAGAGLTVPSAQEVLKGCGVDAARARTLLQILLREKRVVKVAEDLLFHPSAMESLRAMLAVKKGQRFSVPEFKDWTGVSRKYAIPLLEWLDRERMTRRDGDTRIVL
ncbi:MAG: selenocysteine-specific translation elongation factor [Acidobacteria bacterium]|nr:selenocysteine-specific translation elongation factor [Acidobacteriota bacterium]